MRTSNQQICLNHFANLSVPLGIRVRPFRCVAERPAVYAVDDDEGLTELYAIHLETAGFRVKTFNDRVKALAALTADAERPDLLITDYRGGSMSVDEFMQQCRAVHPNLRILMASGFNETDAPCLGGRADRFIRKPFTSEEFLREVHATLAD